jgi:hypothetical protein
MNDRAIALRAAPAFALDGKASIDLGKNRFGIKARPSSEDR